MKDVKDGQILINQIQVVHEAQENKEDKGLEADEILLWHLIKKLPAPKMENLRRFAFHVCIKMYQEKKFGFTELSKFLQMQRTYVSQMRSKLKKEGVFIHKVKQYRKKKPLALVQAKENLNG
jgi:predicted HTH domain antitoxin